ncbi:hypothetical protein [Streptomyces sp. NPDC005752]|uniref:hypothetical protein n=1 Tax=Streptomyces sp. NPDC005752 TaxID=3157065 RepID=UPI0033D9F234
MVAATITLRGVDVPAEAREKVTGYGDTELPGRWPSRAVTASLGRKDLHRALT